MIQKLTARIRAIILRKAREIVRRDVRTQLAREAAYERERHYRSGGTSFVSEDSRAYFEAVQRRNALIADIHRLIPA